MLAPLVKEGDASHWILVACPPTFTRHIGRWVSAGGRQQWRERWAADLLAKVELMFEGRPGVKIEKMVAKRPLLDVAVRLDQRLGGIKVFDARRPRLGKPGEPLTAGAESHELSRWTYPLAISSGLSAMLALAD
jgi:hypothetical protein